MRLQPTGRPDRAGTAATELAVVLPFLVFALVVAVDFARVYYHTQVVTACARNGAMYGSHSPERAANAPAVAAAAKADAGDLPETPTVTSMTGSDASGNPYISVTVSCPFRTITHYPGVPTEMNVTRTVQMRVTAMLPANSQY